MNILNFKINKYVRYSYVMIGLLFLASSICLLEAEKNDKNVVSGRKLPPTTTNQKLRTTRKTTSPIESARRSKSSLAPSLRANLIQKIDNNEDNANNSSTIINNDNNDNNQADKRDYYEPITTTLANNSGMPSDNSPSIDNNSNDNDDNPMRISNGETELASNLMNSARDRIAAVKSLLQNQTSISNNSTSLSTTGNQFSGEFK